MSETIAFKITVDTEVGELSVGELKEGFKQLQQELDKTQQGTEKYKQTLSKMGEVKGALKDVKEQIQALDPEKRFRAIANMGASIASGFQAAQGAMAIFGMENENLLKVLTKVQAATALAQGLQGLAGFAKSMETARLAMIAFSASNPFTAMAVAVTALVGVIAGLVVAFGDFRSEQEKALEKATEHLKVEEGKTEALKTQENSLRLQGKTEREILELKIKQYNATISAREQQIKANIETLKAQVEAEQRYKDILSTILKFVEAPVYVLLKGVDLLGQALGKEWDIANKFTDSIANLLFDPEGTKKKGDEAIKAQKDALAQMVSERDGFMLSIRAIDKKAADERKAALDKEMADIDARHKQKMEIIEREAEAQQEANTQSLNNWQTNMKIFEEEDKRFKEEEKRREQILSDFKKTLQFQTFQTIGDLALAFAGKSEEGQRRAFAINKAAGIAQATIETYVAAQGAYKSQMTVPSPDAPVRAAIAAGIAIAQGLARVALIAKTQFQASGIPSGGGGNSVNIPNIGSPLVQNQALSNATTPIVQTPTGPGFNQPIKAVVVETDVTSTQRTIKSIEERNTF